MKRLRITTTAALLVAALAVAATTAPGASAGGKGGGAVTTTEHTHKQTYVIYDYGLCQYEEQVWQITITSNGVSHESEAANGSFHGTFTETGTVSVVPVDATLVPAHPEDEESPLIPAPSDPDPIPGATTFEGRFTQWGGFNGTEESGGGTFTFNVNLTGSDGSTLRVHFVGHGHLNAAGHEQDFEKERCF